VADLKGAVNNKLYSDVQLQLSDSILYGNRMILSARSDYFRTLFLSEFQERLQNSLEFKESDFLSMLAVFTFVYTNHIEFENIEDIVSVLITTERFLLDDMKQIIEQYLEDGMDTDNSVDILLLSEVANTPKLKQACITRIANNLEMMKNSPVFIELMKQISVKTLHQIDFIHSKAQDLCGPSGGKLFVNSSVEVS